MTLSQYFNKRQLSQLFVVGALLFSFQQAFAQVKFMAQTGVTQNALYFDGEQVAAGSANTSTKYNYRFGNSISPHGDCIKSYKNYVFMTWYRGGKLDRHMMLTRYNMETGVLKTIEFPHQHTGHNGLWWIGETHNTIAVGVSPKNGTVHMVFDMHAYGNSGKFMNDYFRYSYSVEGAAEVPDDEFTLDLFVKDPIDNDYRHCTMDGVRDAAHYSKFTYPKFFLNEQGDLFLTIRKGTSYDGGQAFIKYDSDQEKWGRFKLINKLGENTDGKKKSIYGNVKYVDGKIRIGFQRRLNDGTDKYKYQNGVYYAYSDDPTGASQWKNYKGEDVTIPLANSKDVMVYEPGDWVTTTQKDKVYIVGGFDWTVTERGDVHIVSLVKDNENNVSKSIHSYQPGGTGEFIHTTDFGGTGALYTSGNDVYLIGLRSGRVYVDKVEGGTNNFTSLYQATTGPKFSRGVVYIKDGKVYYYLKGSDNDDTHPTYLQIFDLGISEDSDSIVGGSIPSSVTFPDEENTPDTPEVPETPTNPELPTELSTKSSVHVSFEDEAEDSWVTDGEAYGVTPTIIDGTNVRAGAKVMALQYTGKTSGHHVQNTVDVIAVPDQHYFHMIAYSATSDVANGYTFPTAMLDDWKPTPGFSNHAQTDVFERKITSRQNTKGATKNCGPRLRSKAQTGACVVYYDDVVLYTSASDKVDLVAPTSTQNATLVDGKISWTAGIDSLSGVQSTLVLRTANTTAQAPELKAQASYSTSDDATSISTIGEWTVVADLAEEATSYTVNDASNSYQYAIVHRDLAYNYSIASLVKEGTTALSDGSIVPFQCVGLTGTIALSELQQGDAITVHSISGVNVNEQISNASTINISLPQGMYIVAVNAVPVKVVVK